MLSETPPSRDAQLRACERGGDAHAGSDHADSAFDLPRAPEAYPLWVSLDVELDRSPGPQLSAQIEASLSARFTALASASPNRPAVYAAWWERGWIDVEEVGATGLQRDPLALLGAGVTDLDRPRPARVLRVRAREAWGRCRPGLAAVSLAAQALGQRFGGRVVDRSLCGLAPHPGGLRLRADALVHVGRHLRVPASFDPYGEMWLSTVGLAKFGGPELEMRRVPSELLEPAARVLAGVGQCLVDRGGPLDPSRLRHGLELCVTLAELQWALGLELGDRGEASPNWTRVWLRPAGPGGRRLEVGAPGSAYRRAEPWLRAALRDLVGMPAPRSDAAPSTSRDAQPRKRARR